MSTKEFDLIWNQELAKRIKHDKQRDERIAQEAGISDVRELHYWIDRVLSGKSNLNGTLTRVSE
jgi:hypothetical protein